MSSSSGIIKSKVLPPLRPSNSNLQKIKADEVDLVRLKERFDKQLPKYGFLWKSLNNARLSKDHGVKSSTTVKARKVAVDEDDKENNNITKASLQRKNNEKLDDDGEQPNLLDAILNKQPVSLRVPSSNDHELLCGEDCNCAEPIIEIDNEDEDASVYDVDVDEELADTDDERNMSTVSSAKMGDDEKSTNNNMDSNLDENGVEIDIEDSLSSDDSILVISKTPKKKKMFIIDSDDESEVEDGRGDEESEEDSDKIEEKSVTSSDIVPTSPSKRSTRSRLRNSKRATTKSKPLKIMDDDGDDDFKSTSSEEEWIELSSDEEDDIQNNKNTVVILDDDEEDESEDQHSAFTISSGDSDNSSDDESEVKFRKTTTSKRPENKKTSSGGQQPTTKPVAKRKPNTKRNQSKSRSKATSFSKNRDTLTSHTFSEFNETAFQNKLSAVTVTWSNKLNTTAGITRMRGKLGKDNAHTRVATIELATKVIDNEERLRSTLLHEMCHVAQWLIEGVHKPPHGPQFKKWANISMRKIRDVEVTTTHDYQISYKYAWACTSLDCKVVIKRHSRSVDPTKHCCGRCQGKLIEIEANATNSAGVAPTPKKTRKVSEYALFIKSESAKIRKRLAKERSCNEKQVSQADVMKECGKLWRRKKEKGGTENDGLEDMADKLVNMTLDESGAS